MDLNETLRAIPVSSEAASTNATGYMIRGLDGECIYEHVCGEYPTEERIAGLREQYVARLREG
jgi:hypothetical protein